MEGASRGSERTASGRAGGGPCAYPALSGSGASELPACYRRVAAWCSDCLASYCCFCLLTRLVATAGVDSACVEAAGRCYRDGAASTASHSVHGRSERPGVRHGRRCPKADKARLSQRMFMTALPAVPARDCTCLGEQPGRLEGGTGGSPRASRTQTPRPLGLWIWWPSRRRAPMSRPAPAGYGIFVRHMGAASAGQPGSSTRWRGLHGCRPHRLQLAQRPCNLAM
jgi:hypothetical protein